MTKNIGFTLLLILLLCIGAFQIFFLIFGSGSIPELVMLTNWLDVFYRSTMYMIVGILILIEFKSLDLFHIDRFTLVTFIIGAFIRRSVPGDTIFRVIIGCLGVLIIISMLRSKPKILRTNIRFTFISIGLATVSLILIVVTEMIMRGHWQLPPLISDSLTLTVLNATVKEFSMGAVIEEMMFRGFLWGYLVRRNWDSSRIIWTQGLIFWLLHISRLGTPFTLFLLVPLITVVTSKLTNHTKQVFPAAIYHTIINVAGSLLNLGTY